MYSFTAVLLAAGLMCATPSEIPSNETTAAPELLRTRAIPVYLSCSSCRRQYQRCLKNASHAGPAAIVRCEKSYDKCKSTCK